MLFENLLKSLNRNFICELVPGSFTFEEKMEGLRLFLKDFLPPKQVYAKYARNIRGSKSSLRNIMMSNEINPKVKRVVYLLYCHCSISQPEDAVISFSKQSLFIKKGME